jgi:hypothetical protein
MTPYLTKENNKRNGPLLSPAEKAAGDIEIVFVSPSHIFVRSISRKVFEVST